MTDLPAIALSVRQPWAWAILHAGKHLENRSQGAMRHMDKAVTHIAIHAFTGEPDAWRPIPEYESQDGDDVANVHDGKGS